MIFDICCVDHVIFYIFILIISQNLDAYKADSLILDIYQDLVSISLTTNIYTTSYSDINGFILW